MRVWVESRCAGRFFHDAFAAVFAGAVIWAVVGITNATATSTVPPPEPTHDELLDALENGTPMERLSAAARLWPSEPASTRLVGILTDSALHADRQVRVTARITLRNIAPPLTSVPARLGKAVSDSKPSIRAAAIAAIREILMRVPDPAVERQPLRPLLHKALADKYTGVRRRAVSALGYLRPVEQATVWLLIGAMSDPESTVRGDAAHALGRIEPAPAEAVEPLIEALSDVDPIVRFYSAGALSNEFGSAGHKAIPALLTALEDEERDVRIQATRTLAAIDPAPVAVDALLRAIKSQHPEVRVEAADALGKIGLVTIPVVNALIAALVDTDPDARHVATEAVGRLGKGAEAAIPALIGRLGDTESSIRVAAAEALGRFGAAAREATPALQTALTDFPAWGRPKVAVALGAVAAREEVEPTLLWMYESPDKFERAIAALALGRLLPGEDGIFYLAVAVKTGSHPVIKAAAGILRDMGPAAATAVPALEEVQGRVSGLGIKSALAAIKAAE